MKLPPVLQRLIAAEAAKSSAAELARFTANAPAGNVGKGNTQPRPDVRLALGLRLKGMWMSHPMHAAKAMDTHRDWAKKSAGPFESLFGQGGSLFRQEYSSEIIEMLRPKTVLLKAGVRTETYENQFNIGRLNGGAVAEYVAEGKAPATSKLDTGAVMLQSHKVMAIYEPSNDQLRNPSVNSAEVLSDDLMQAIGLATDKAGFIGDGTGANPMGLVKQVHKDNKVTGVAITQANAANVIRFIDSFEQRVKASNLELEGNAPFWSFSSAVEMALKGLTFGAGGFIYRDQLEQGKLNGKPVHITEAYGDNYFFFGLAAQYYYGQDVKAGGTIIVDMSQPHFAEDLTMIKALTYNDWKLRHNRAFAYSDDVKLS